jgi:hypothetical protein
MLLYGPILVCARGDIPSGGGGELLNAVGPSGGGGGGAANVGSGALGIPDGGGGGGGGGGGALVVLLDAFGVVDVVDDAGAVRRSALGILVRNDSAVGNDGN